MFIYWKKQVSKKNKPPINPRFYEVSYYCYLVDNVQERTALPQPSNPAHSAHPCTGKYYLGSIKEIGGELSPYRIASFYLDVKRRLLEKNFSQRKIYKVFNLIGKKVSKSTSRHLKTAENLI